MSEMSKQLLRGFSKHEVGFVIFLQRRKDLNRHAKRSSVPVCASVTVRAGRQCQPSSACVHALYVQAHCDGVSGRLWTQLVFMNTGKRSSPKSRLVSCTQSTSTSTSTRTASTSTSTSTQVTSTSTSTSTHNSISSTTIVLEHGDHWHTNRPILIEFHCTKIAAKVLKRWRWWYDGRLLTRRLLTQFNSTLGLEETEEENNHLMQGHR